MRYFENRAYKLEKVTSNTKINPKKKKITRIFEKRRYWFGEASFGLRSRRLEDIVVSNMQMNN